MKHNPQFRNGPNKDAQLSNVALLYYGEGLTQSEIAKRFKVSRATIVAMLKECRDRSIVDIRVRGEHLTGSTLSRDLREKFDLTDVYVAQCGENDTNDRAHQLRQLARVAATAILDVCRPGDRVGVAWGETILAVSEQMPVSRVEHIEVSQLIGSMISERVPASENCAIQIASKLGAQCFTLHAPAIVSSKALADMLRQEPTINQQLQRLEDLDVTIASVGHVHDDTHLMVAGMASAEDLQEAKKAGAVGILCCRYIDTDGNAIKAQPDERLIAADLEHLKKVSRKILVVAGADRLEATQAAIKGDLVTHLCVDDELAKALLMSK